MTVTDVRRDAAALTMTITAEFDAPVERVWQLWANPRLLEQWWGPPTWPATFVDHDLSVGGEVTYYMTGPDGERAGGWWTVVAVDPPHSFEFQDGFSNPDGTKNRDMPMSRGRVTITPEGGGTRMELSTVFPSIEAMEQLVAMGMEEGIRSAMGQMDALLA
jgi:uncharacterized protein YndB with AHSA1/START domain